MRLVVKVFFKQVSVMGLDSFPIDGPVVVACNHNNQFVDAMMLIATLPRPVNFIMAASSKSNRFLKVFLKVINVISTVRPTDLRRRGTGRIEELKDGVLSGSSCRFRDELKPGCSIRVDGSLSEVQVIEVIDDCKVRVRVEEGAQEPGPLPDGFDIFPKVSQEEVFANVVELLGRGEVVAIFPEGGSHDQTFLLPLKAGACVFVWEAKAKTGTDTALIPVGISYFGRSKFRSKVVFNVGEALRMIPEVSRMAERGYKAQFIAESLRLLRSGMESLKLVAPTFRELQNIYTAKEIFMLPEAELDSQRDFQLSLKFAAGYLAIKDLPEVKLVNKKLYEFRRNLRSLGFKVSDMRRYRALLQENLFPLLLRILILFFLVV